MACSGLHFAGNTSITRNSSDKPGGLSAYYRTPANKLSNNTMRELFLNTVSDLFGGEDNIPSGVRTAMRMKNFDDKGSIINTNTQPKQPQTIKNNTQPKGFKELTPQQFAKLSPEAKVKYMQAQGNSKGINVMHNLGIGQTRPNSGPDKTVIVTKNEPGEADKVLDNIKFTSNKKKPKKLIITD